MQNELMKIKTYLRNLLKTFEMYQTNGDYTTCKEIDPSRKYIQLNWGAKETRFVKFGSFSSITVVDKQHQT